MGTNVQTTRVHLDKLDDEGVLACLKLVLTFAVYDQQVNTIRRHRRAEELINQVEAGKGLDRARRFLASCADGSQAEEASAFLKVSNKNEKT